MKKYLFGILAIALAIGFSAFTKPVKGTFTDVIFTGNTASQTSVEDESLWQEGTPFNCDGTDDRACTINVDVNSLTGSSPRILNSSLVTITANVGGDAGQYKVASLAGTGSSGATYTNKD